jgi:hypothetical protein
MMSSMVTLNIGITVFLIGLLLSAVGCGGNDSGAASEESARAALTNALDAWKSGRTADEMRRQTPEVVVGDSAWKQGRKLTSYQIGNGQFDGKNLRVPVTLTLAQPPRGSNKLIVNYIVSTKPVITIFRDSD